MKKAQRFLGFFMLLPVFVFAQLNDTISKEDVKNTLEYLASDQLKGRANYSKELNTAANFIAGQFSKDFLQTYPGSGSYFQPFMVKRGSEISGVDTNGKYDPSKTLLNVIGVLKGRSL